MYFDQDGQCLLDICSNEAIRVDHDHKCCPGRKSCGRCIRGLLCDSCNLDLGIIENEAWFKSAQSYLSLYA